MNRIIFSLGLTLILGLFIVSVNANPPKKDTNINNRMEIRIVSQQGNEPAVTFDTTIINPSQNKEEMSRVIQRINGQMGKMKDVFCHLPMAPLDSVCEDFVPPLEELGNFEDFDALGEQLEKEVNSWEMDEGPCFREFPSFEQFSASRGEDEKGEAIRLDDPDIISYQKTPVGKDKEKIVIIRKKKLPDQKELKSL